MKDPKELQKEMGTETKITKKWLKDIDALLKLPDDDYKFRQLNNAVSAIYTGYQNLSTLLRNYKP